VPYTPDKPGTVPPSEELRRTVPGWGVDLDPADRPSHKREVESETGAHWEFPERQPERAARERSTEHATLTPVFGTAQPLHGLSGAIRRRAYNLSEGRLEHWLLLVAGDRVDMVESHLAAAIRGRPDNPITESGVLREFKGRAYRTRFGQHRVDLKHQPIDVALFTAPYAAAAAGVYLVARGLARRVRGARP
jgi:hypothetical protein